MIETIKDNLNFCDSAIYFDYNKIGRVLQLSDVRKCNFDNFNETVPESKILECLRIIDDMILKINENEIESIVELREKIIYMIGYKKMKGNKI